MYSGYARREAPAPVGDLPVVANLMLSTNQGLVQTGAPSVSGNFFERMFQYENSIIPGYVPGITEPVFVGSSYNPSWSEGSTYAIDADSSVVSTTEMSPEGVPNAVQIHFNAVADTGVDLGGWYGKYCFVWVKKTSGTGAIRWYSTASSTYSSDIAISETWTRIQCGADGVDSGYYLVNSTSATAQDILVWAAVAGSNPLTKFFTEAATTHNIYNRDGSYPSFSTAMARGVYTIRFAPVVSSTDMALGGFGFGTYAPVSTIGNSLYLKLSTTGYIEMQDIAATVLMSVGPITYSALQMLSVTVDMVAKTLTVSGATTGDGTGSAGTFLPSSLRLYPSSFMVNLNGPFIYSTVVRATEVDSPILEILPEEFAFGYGTIDIGGWPVVLRFTAPANTTGGFLTPVVSDSPPEDKRNGEDGWYLCDNGGTNYVPYSTELVNAAWTATDATVAIAASGSAPQEAADCYQVDFDALETANLTTDMPDLAYSNGEVYYLVNTIWARMVSGTGSIRLGTKDLTGTVQTSSDLALTTTWKRIEWLPDWSVIGDGSVIPQFIIQNGTAGDAQSVLLWEAVADQSFIACPASNVDYPTMGSAQTSTGWCCISMQFNECNKHLPYQFQVKVLGSHAEFQRKDLYGQLGVLTKSTSGLTLEGDGVSDYFSYQPPYDGESTAPSTSWARGDALTFKVDPKGFLEFEGVGGAYAAKTTNITSYSYEVASFGKSLGSGPFRGLYRLPTDAV